VRGEVYLTEIGRALAVEVEPLRAVPDLLSSVAEAVELPFAEVERRSVDGAARPCAGCGFRGHPCRGQ
jgi:hypothetical protein